MSEESWAINIDLEGFSKNYEDSEDRKTYAIWGLHHLMDAIINIGNSVYRDPPERLFAHQFGDGPLWIIQVADIAHMSGTLPRTGRSDLLLDSGKAEDALLSYPLPLVEINFLIGTGLHAEAVAFTLFFTDQDNAIFFPLIDGCAGTGLHTGRMGAVVTDTRQVKEEAVGECSTTNVLIPVGTPGGGATCGPEI